MKYEHERAIAIEAVLKACQLCRDVQRSLTDEDKMTKSDRSPVTVADFGSQAIIVSHVLQAFSNDPIVGEEEATVLRQSDQTALKVNVIALVRTVEPDLSEQQILDAIDHGAQMCEVMPSQNRILGKILKRWGFCFLCLYRRLAG